MICSKKSLVFSLSKRSSCEYESKFLKIRAWCHFMSGKVKLCVHFLLQVWEIGIFTYAIKMCPCNSYIQGRVKPVVKQNISIPMWDYWPETGWVYVSASSFFRHFKDNCHNLSPAETVCFSYLGSVKQCSSLVNFTNWRCAFFFQNDQVEEQRELFTLEMTGGQLKSRSQRSRLTCTQCKKKEELSICSLLTHEKVGVWPSQPKYVSVAVTFKVGFKLVVNQINWMRIIDYWPEAQSTNLESRFVAIGKLLAIIFV